MSSRELIETVDRLPRSSISTSVVRHVAPGYLAMSGEGAHIHGGRWNAPGSFAVLYTAFDRTTTIAEMERAARRQGLIAADLLPRDEVTYAIELQRVLDLTSPAALEGVQLGPESLASVDWGQCQAVGEAAHYVGFEAVLAPSATRRGSTLAIFLDRLLFGSVLEVISVRSLELDD